MLEEWEDKRRFPRAKVACEMQYQIPGTPEFTNAVTNNVSAGGIGFISDRFIPPKTPLKLEIRLLSRMLNSVGQVTRSINMPHSDRYYSGIEFLNLDERDRQHISNYINLTLE